MKRKGLSFAARLSIWFATVIVVLWLSLVLAAYFLLYREAQELDRQVVRAQLEIYQAWYAEGGLWALGAVGLLAGYGCWTSLAGRARST